MKFSCSRLVQEEGHIRVTLEDAGRQVRGHRPFNQSVNSIGFLVAVSHHGRDYKGSGRKSPGGFSPSSKAPQKNGQEAWALCPAADEPQGLSFRTGAKDEPPVRVDEIVDKWTTRWIFLRDALRHLHSSIIFSIPRPQCSIYPAR